MPASFSSSKSKFKTNHSHLTPLSERPHQLRRRCAHRSISSAVPTTCSTRAAGGILNTTRGIQTCSGSYCVFIREINTECNPSKDTITNVLPKQGVLYNRVRRSRFLGKNAIIRIRGQILRIGGVGGSSFDFGDEILVEEELSNMGDVATPIGTVGVGGAIEVGEDVDVVCAGGVVAWEESSELGNAERIRWLEAAKEGCVDVGGVRGITVAGGDNTGVDTSAIAVCALLVWCCANSSSQMMKGTYARSRSLHLGQDRRLPCR